MGGGPELLADTLFGAAALADIACDAAEKADLVWGLHVDGDRIERLQLGVVQGENAFHDDYAGRRDGVETVGARVGLEVVDGALDGLAVGEFADVFDDEFRFEGVGVVEVLLVAAIERELREVAVVEVEREEGRVELGG